MIRDKNIRQLQKILLMQRLVAYLMVLKYLRNLIEKADEQGQVNSDYIYLGSVPIARVDEWWENMPMPKDPEGATIVPGDKQLAVSWNESPAPIDGYKVYWGVESGKYTSSVDVGKITSYTISGLTNEEQKRGRFY